MRIITGTLIAAFAIVQTVAAVPVFADEPPVTPVTPAAPATPATEDAGKPAAGHSTGKEVKSTITDGSYSFDASGQVRMEYEFQGEEMFIDLQIPAVLVAKSGMPQTEFLKAAAESGLRVRPLSDSEFMVGEEKVAIFVGGKLTRIRK